MKTLGFVFCLFVTTALAGQIASVISNEPQPIRIPDHPQYASQRAMGDERSLLLSHGFTIGEGQKPLWEVAGNTAETPLGDVARKLRKEHASAKKAVVSLEK